MVKDETDSNRLHTQFPSEQEHVIVPLSNFEIIGMRKDPKYPCLNVLEISLNINLNAQKLEGVKELVALSSLELE